MNRTPLSSQLFCHSGFLWPRLIPRVCLPVVSDSTTFPAPDTRIQTPWTQTAGPEQLPEPDPDPACLPACTSVCLHVCPYARTYVRTPTYLPTDLRTYLPTYLPTYKSTNEQNTYSDGRPDLDSDTEPTHRSHRQHPCCNKKHESRQQARLHGHAARYDMLQEAPWESATTRLPVPQLIRTHEALAFGLAVGCWLLVCFVSG